MKKSLLLLVLFSLNSFAGYELLAKGAKIVCDGADGQRFTLNQARTKLKWETEGESLGFKRIITKKSDARTYAEFTTQEVTLRLTLAGDSVYFNGDTESTEDVDCH
jgi:hypothetical protein